MNTNFFEAHIFFLLPLLVMMTYCACLASTDFFEVMLKELAQVCENLKQDLKRNFQIELKNYKESWESDSTKQFREVKSSISSISHAYKKVKKQLESTLKEAKGLRKTNA